MADFPSIASSAADLLTHEIELNPDNLFLAVRATLQPPTTSTNTVDLTAYDALLPRTAS